MTEEKAKKEIEELEKEATEYATEYANRFWGKKESLDRACTIDNFKDGYLAGAEPREKRIEELEAQIEEMKCCENCKHFDFDEPKYCHKGVFNCAYVCDKWALAI